MMPGCQPRPQGPEPWDGGQGVLAGDSEAGPYARVSPRELNPNLTEEQLGRMYVRLAEVPWQADPNISALPAGTGQPQSEGAAGNSAGCKDYLQGRWLMRKGLYAEAIGTLLQGTAADPNQSAMVQLLAEAYFQIGDNAAGVKACHQVLRRDPGNMAALQLLGNAAMARGDHGQAAWFFHQALDAPGATGDNPMTVVMHVSLGGALLEMGYYSAAADQYHQVYKLLLEQSRYAQSNPILKEFVRQLHLPLLTQASISVQMGQLDRAAAALQEAQQFLSGEVDLISAFTISLAKQRKPIRQRYSQVSLFCRYLLTIVEEKEEVLDLFYEACGEMSKQEAYPAELEGWYRPPGRGKGLLSAREYAAGLILCGEKQKAREILTSLLQQSDEAEWVHFDMARLDGQELRWQEMITHYGQALELQPASHAAILAEIDTIQANIPELDEQIKRWGTTVDSAVPFGSSFLIGHLLEESGETEAAEKYFRQAIDQKPEFLEGRIHLVELLLRNKKYDEILQWAGENGIPDPRLISQVARAYSGLGQFDRAEEKYRELIALQPEDVDAYLALGEVLYKQMEHSQAEEVLLRVLNNWPGREEVYRQLLKLYADWSVQKQIDVQMRLRAEKRTREMLTRWMEYKTSADQRGHPLAARKATGAGQEVLRTLEDFTREYPEGRIAGILLSGLYAAEQQYDRAVLEIERVRVFYPDDEEVLKAAAELQGKAGHWEAAAELRYRIWQLRPDQVQSLVAVLQAMRQAGKYQQALDILVQAVREKSWGQTPSETDIPSNTIVPVETEPAGKGPADQSLAAIRLLHNEAVRLFMITRHYWQAVELFQQWRQEAQAAGEAGELTAEQGKEADDIGRKVTESLLWAIIETGDFERAGQEVIRYYRLDPPTDPSVALHLLQSLNVRLRYAESLEILQELLTEKPDEMAFHLTRAITRIESGRNEEAIEGVQQWAAAQPESKERKRLLIVTLRRAGEYEAAAAEIGKSMEAEPERESYRLQLADLWLEAGNLEEAEKVIGKIRQSSSSSEGWFEAQLKLEIAREKPEAAFSLLDEQANEENAVAVQYMKVKIYAALGQTERAIELLQPILEKDPQNIEMRLEYSIYLQRAGRTSEAIALLEEIQRQNPEEADIKNNLGYLMIEEHYDLERAGRLVRESLEVDPLSAPTLDSMGWWYYKQGQFEKALEFLYQSAARMVRVDSEVLDHLGDTLYRLNREKEAAVYWQMALEDVKSRILTERYLEDNKILLEKKLQQLQEGVPPDISVLFANQPIGD